jgi:hypothetical protein
VACPGVCWDGGGGSSNRFWSTAANWSLDTLPGISDSVYLNMPGGATVLLNDTRTIAALFSDIGNNFAIINGGSLTVTGAATASDLQGELTIAGGNLTVDGFGSMLNVLRVVGTSAASPGIPPGTLGGSGNVTVRGGSSLSGGFQAHDGFGCSGVCVRLRCRDGSLKGQSLLLRRSQLRERRCTPPLPSSGLGCQGHGGCLHGGIEPVLREEVADMLPRERKQYVIDERDRRGGALDVEQDSPASKDDHDAVLPSPAIHAGPMQSGS